MSWPDPPGFQPPGIGFIFLIGGVVFCLLGIAVYLTVKKAMAQCGPSSSQQSPEQPPPSSPASQKLP